MSLTFADLLNEVSHVTGSDEASRFQTQTGIINQALEYFNSMWAWDGMVALSADLASTAGNRYIDLPADCRDVIAVDSNGSGIGCVQLTSAAMLNRYWSSDNQGDLGGSYWAARATRPGSTGPVDVLAIYPAIGTTSTDGFQITYRRKLVPMNDGLAADTTYVQVPSMLEGLVRRLVQIFAAGIEEIENASIEERLEALERSAYLERLKCADGDMLPTLGPMLGPDGYGYLDPIVGGELELPL